MTNMAVLIGNVGADPISRSTQSGGTVTQVSLATSRRWNDKNTGETQEETEWHRITCFNGLGDIVAKFVRKGSKISVRGSIHYTSWTSPDGEKKYGVEIRADAVEFLSKAPEAKRDEPAALPARKPRASAKKPALAGNFADGLDDDVPF